MRRAHSGGGGERRRWSAREKDSLSCPSLSPRASRPSAPFHPLLGPLSLPASVSGLFLFPRPSPTFPPHSIVPLLPTPTSVERARVSPSPLALHPSRGSLRLPPWPLPPPSGFSSYAPRSPTPDTHAPPIPPLPPLLPCPLHRALFFFPAAFTAPADSILALVPPDAAVCQPAEGCHPHPPLAGLKTRQKIYIPRRTAIRRCS